MKSIEQCRQQTKVPVVMADQTGTITYVNERFESVFGYPQKDIVGRPLAIIIPQNMRDAHHLGFSRFLTTGRPTLLNQPLTLKVVAKDGREFDAEHLIVAEQQQGRWVFAATIRPLNTV